MVDPRHTNSFRYPKSELTENLHELSLWYLGRLTLQLLFNLKKSWLSQLLSLQHAVSFSLRPLRRIIGFISTSDLLQVRLESLAARYGSWQRECLAVFAHSLEN